MLAIYGTDRPDLTGTLLDERDLPSMHALLIEQAERVRRNHSAGRIATSPLSSCLACGERSICVHTLRLIHSTAQLMLTIKARALLLA